VELPLEPEARTVIRMQRAYASGLWVSRFTAVFYNREPPWYRFERHRNGRSMKTQEA